MLWALIMAGGQGTRFWPESRAKNPKQFLKIFGRQSLLEQTVSRLGKIIPRSRIIIVTQKDKVALAAKISGLPKSQVLGEPVGRNTAPCAVLVASLILRKDPEAVLAILPADHHIADENHFRNAVKTAALLTVETQLPVTFGIKPVFAHTGYGYLETSSLYKRCDGFSIYRLKRFHEKPNHVRARKFLAARKYYWNGGIFIWQADALLQAARACLPKAYQLAKSITEGNFEDGMKRSYRAMPNISIDYGLMEKLRGRILTIPVDMGWSDVGDWKSLAEFWDRDKFKNAALGKTLFIESAGNIVKSDKRLIALVGVDHLVVVDTPDALLVTSKDKTESIRRVVGELKKRDWKEYL